MIRKKTTHPQHFGKTNQFFDSFALALIEIVCSYYLIIIKICWELGDTHKNAYLQSPATPGSKCAKNY